MACHVKLARTMISPRTYGLAAAAVCALASGFELIRVIANRGLERGVATPYSFVLAVIFSVILGVAALGLAMHRQLGYVAAVLAFVAAMSYGSVMRSAGNMVGIAYIFVAAALFPLIVKSLPYYREERPVPQAP
jgi:hypothetical protein